MNEKQKRRWYQFSLRTLLVVLMLLCLGPGGYVAYEQSTARRQRAAVEAIEKLGGKVEYAKEAPSRSATMREILGNESFGNADCIDLFGQRLSDADLVHLACLNGLTGLLLAHTRVTDSGLRHLAGLKNLPNLRLTNTQVTDAGLVHLTGLKVLTELSLGETKVTDAGIGYLAELKSLTILCLANTRVTDAGAAQLQEQLPDCHIIR